MKAETTSKNTKQRKNCANQQTITLPLKEKKLAIMAHQDGTSNSQEVILARAGRIPPELRNIILSYIVEMKCLEYEDSGIMPGGKRIMSNSRKGILRVPFVQLDGMIFYHLHEAIPRSYFVVGHFWDTLTATCVRMLQLFKSKNKYARFSVGNLHIEMQVMALRFQHEFTWLVKGLKEALDYDIGDNVFGYRPNGEPKEIQGMLVQRHTSLPGYWRGLRPRGIITPINGLDHLLQLYVSYTGRRFFRYTRYPCLVEFMLAIILRGT